MYIPKYPSKKFFLAQPKDIDICKLKHFLEGKKKLSCPLKKLLKIIGSPTLANAKAIDRYAATLRKDDPKPSL